MCGEHVARCKSLPTRLGSSPHVRGALRQSKGFFQSFGIIPACAGSTRSAFARHTSMRDHPRMCGEHTWFGSSVYVGRGSSPHVRGAPRQAPERLIPAGGSSPHVRGAQSGGQHGNRQCGIIPACAGSTRSSFCPLPARRDHPRMCGEHSACVVVTSGDTGSSPHVRGARCRCRLRQLRRGIIPACAGSTECMILTIMLTRDHPRMCGEHVVVVVPVLAKEGSSPHVRGAQATA